jgi:hypothetical protein
VPVRDLVTVSKAEATCSVATQRCTLVVNAASSDVTGAPVLTLQHTGTALVNGVASVADLASLPADVTVTSAAGGAGSLPVTVIKQ